MDSQQNQLGSGFGVHTPWQGFKKNRVSSLITGAAGFAGAGAFTFCGCGAGVCSAQDTPNKKKETTMHRIKNIFNSLFRWTTITRDKMQLQ
tara:strand:- start:496 stop:768 length:273 start_codon:yes stop_codon:yes gene_type:complete